MAIRLYIENVGPVESSELEVKINTESRIIEINGEKHFSENLHIFLGQNIGKENIRPSVWDLKLDSME